MLSFVPPSRRSLLRESRFALVAPLAALVAYFPAIVVPYGFMDDYYLLAWQRGLEGEFWKTATQFGRPLHALFLSGAFGLASDIGALRLVRLLGLLGVMLLALFLYYVLRQAGVAGGSRQASACPSSASRRFRSMFPGRQSSRRRTLRFSPVWHRFGCIPLPAWKAGACTSVGARPPCFFFARCSAISPPPCSSGSSLRSTSYAPIRNLLGALRKFGESLAVAAVALFFGYVAVRIGVHFYGGAFAGRTNLVHDFVGKARWFWNEPIVNSLGMFNLIPTASVALAIAVVAAIGILLLHSESGPRALGFLGLAVAFVPLSYTPNLVISENFASYRSTAALATLVTLYLWFGLWGIARALTSSARPARRRVVKLVFVLALAALASFAALALVVVPLLRPLEQVSVHTLTSGPELAAFALLFIIFAGTGLWATRDSGRRTFAMAVGALAMTAFVLGGVLIAARNVTTLVVKPQSVELQLVRSELSSERTRGPHLVVFVKPSYTEGAAPLVRYDEFGPPSTYFPWVPSPAVRLVLRERLPRAHPALTILAWDQAPASRDAQGDAFVDMRELEKRRVGWSFWTLHAAPRTTPAADAPSARRQ